MKNIAFCLAAWLLLSCGSKKESDQKTLVIEEHLIDSEYSGSCPYLFTSGKDAVVFSWIRTTSEGTSSVCFATSRDGIDFDKTAVVPGSNTVKAHGENPPKVVLSPDGKILAAWGVTNPGPKNPYSGLVYYSVSLDKGLNWTAPARISEDSASIDQRYFDLEILPDGNIGAVWLDNRSGTNSDGSGLYFAKLGSSNSFENEKRVDNTTCQCCRTDLFVDDKGALHVAYRKIIEDTVRDMVHIVSTDNGNNFSSPQRISPDNWKINGCPHTGPAIAQNKDGLHFVWYTMGTGNGIFHSSSDDNGKTFSQKEYVSNQPSAKHPQIRALENGKIATVWDDKTNEKSRIAFEIRSGKGKEAAISTRYLTGNSSSAAYPVISSINKRLLIAYSTKDDPAKPERVAFQLVDQL